ncbi:MAG TPA: alpha/beta fold hydrolase [Candidatus Aminicenantes bacterium]|nr:lysophospholipase [Candidatus Aminicenantes bacterium]HDT13042.1 alpha/beta fold hydrolase [Candidatus Aminicenantes bacterium]
MTGLHGTDVLFRRWDARPDAASPRAVLLLVHGLGAHSGRWTFLAEYFAGRGYASYAIELRGFGRTPERPRGHVRSFEVWGRDIMALRDELGRDFPDRKVFLVGESMGGLIAYDLAGRYPDRFDGTVLMAPAFRNGLTFPLGAYVKVALLSPFKPAHMIDLPFTSEMATRDADYAAAMNADPDELRAASLKLMAGFLPLQARAGRMAKRFRSPALFLIPGVDHLVDERAARRIFGRLGAADKTLVEYPEMFHALYIDLGREKVFRDMLGWLEERT